MKTFFSELLRRKVVRSVGAYLVLLWILAQGFAALYPAFGLPPWSLRAFVFTGLGIVPIVALLSWKFDIVPTPKAVLPIPAAATNPGHRYVAGRHDPSHAGALLLRWEGGGAQPHRFVAPVVIGREPGNDVELHDQRVSRCHAVIWAERGHWLVRDLDSANGTYLDGRRIQADVRLPESGTLQFHPEGPKVEVQVLKIQATIMELPSGSQPQA